MSYHFTIHLVPSSVLPDSCLDARQTSQFPQRHSNETLDGSRHVLHGARRPHVALLRQQKLAFLLFSQTLPLLPQRNPLLFHLDAVHSRSGGAGFSPRSLGRARSTGRNHSESHSSVHAKLFLGRSGQRRWLLKVF